ncbi:MAG: hypothetical protein H0X45_16560 [Planctomycetes bacterium]|nr:hypothetical protein [Planctomycetota bacterium]
MSMVGDDTMIHIVFGIAAHGGAATDVAWSARRTRGDLLIGSGVIPTIAADTESGELMVMDHAPVDGDQYIVRVVPLPGDPQPANDVAEITAVLPPETPPPSTVPVGPDQVDLLYNDVHWHGMYYWRDLLFHFYVSARNPNAITVTGARFAISMDGVVVYRGDVPTLPAPTTERPYPRIEVKVTDAQLFGDTNPLRPLRPEPGRHDWEILIEVDPAATYTEADPTSNIHRLPIIAPPIRTWPSQPGALPDLRLADPHIHHYVTSRSLRLHFQATNYHDQTTIPNTRWRIVREDGAVMREGVFGPIAPRALKEMAVSWPYEPLGEVEYRLIYDADGVVDEADESNNQATFIIDTTPTAPG